MTQPARRPAISYIRMSTDRQLDGHSLERQVKATKAYCEKNNLELIDSLQDIGLSGYSGANRSKGQLGQLFQALEAGDAPEGLVVVVESLDRLSRQNPLAALSQFTDLLNYGVELHTLYDGQIYAKDNMATNASLLFLSIGSMIRSFEESETKSKRLKSVWSKKKQDPDSIITSQVPYWIKVHKDGKGKAVRLELRPKEALVIRNIFDLSINQNMGAQAITSYLNKNLDRFPRTRVNSRNKDQGWSESYIKSILNNPAVYGVYQPHQRIDGKRVPDGEPFENYYPQVISKDEFLLNQKKMAQRKIAGKGRKSTNFNNLFRGMLCCRSCGSKMSYKFNVPSKGGSIIKCDLATQKRAGCETLPVKYDVFEDLFFTAFQDVDFISAINNQDFKAKERSLELEIGSLEEQQARISHQVETLVEELLEPNQPEQLKKVLRTKLNSLTQQQEENEELLKKLQDEVLITGNSGIGSLFEDVRSLMAGVDGDELVSLRTSVNVGLQKVIDKIEIDNSPEFSRDDVEDGLLEEDDLNKDFLDWFYSTRTDRWLIKDPLAYVSSRLGFKMHQNFRTLTYVWMKSGEVRIIQPDGTVAKIHA